MIPWASGILPRANRGVYKIVRGMMNLVVGVQCTHTVFSALTRAGQVGGRLYPGLSKFRSCQNLEANLLVNVKKI